jgi:hypothetical protein
MKHNTIAIASMAVSVLAGMASAQDTFSSTTTTTATSSSTPASSSAPRTGLYTGVTKGNAAADNTVDDYSRRPTLIGDKQYLAGWGDGNLVNGAYSIQGLGFNWFGSVLALDSMSQIRAGLAGGTAWGAGVIVGVNRFHVTTPTPGSTETTTYYEPSGFGLFGDLSLGSSDVYGQVGWNTGLPSEDGLQNSVLFNPAVGPEVDNQFHTLSFMAGWKKDATTEGTHAFNIEANYATEMTRPEVSAGDETVNILNVLPAWGYILRANSSYAVFLGANSLISYVKPEDGSAYHISLSPNFAFQKQFGKGFEGFSGFSVSGSWSSLSDIPADGAEVSQLLTGGADMAVGLRWVKDNFALEGSLKEAFLANGPHFIGGNANQGLLGSIGLSLGI